MPEQRFNVPAAANHAEYQHIFAVYVVDDDVLAHGKAALVGSDGVPSAGRLLLGCKAGAATLFDLLGKLAHGFLRDDAPVATRKRAFRLIDGGEDFSPGALAFLP